MVRKVFIIGRPGSGKSTVAGLIKMLASDRGWSTHYINDYELLQKLFLQETDQCTPLEGRKFRLAGPKECNGFDVTDFSVLDTVLEKMREEVKGMSSLEDNTLCLVEFARANYRDALQLFGSNLLQDAHLLYLDVDIESCMERNHRRTDHFISDDIMRDYYHKDDWSEVIFNLRHTWGIRVKTWEVDNTGDYQALMKEIERLADAGLIPELVPV